MAARVLQLFFFGGGRGNPHARTMLVACQGTWCCASKVQVVVQCSMRANESSLLSPQASPPRAGTPRPPLPTPGVQGWLDTRAGGGSAQPHFSCPELPGSSPPTPLHPPTHSTHPPSPMNLAKPYPALMAVALSLMTLSSVRPVQSCGGGKGAKIQKK